MIIIIIIIISNEKTPGHDGIHGFLFKKFTTIHDRLTLERKRCLKEAHVPESMTKGRTTLIPKDPRERTAPNNYRPIICLPMMWIILTALVMKEIYFWLTSRGFSSEKQKWYRKDTEAQENFSTLISTSSTRAIWDGWIWLLPGLITKHIWYGPPKLDYTLS